MLDTISKFIKFDVRNRVTGAVQFTAEIECAADALTSVKLGLAIKWAIKSRANLSGADLSGAYLSGANLSGAKNADLAIAQTRILPEGDLIGWKKLANGAIAKLRIPEDAKRSHAFGRKCRAEFAIVIEGEGVSQYDTEFKYTPGAKVIAPNWDDDWTKECAGGIHFFIQKIEAENY